MNTTAPVEMRLATGADAAQVGDIYRPAVVQSAISFELEPPTATEMAGRIESVLARTPWIVCVRGSAVLGYAYAARHRERPAYQWSVEVSAYVHSDARRQGVGRALYTSLFSVLELQGYRNAFAGITLPNPASVALHQSLGFSSIGVYPRIGYKAGAWHDVQWLGRELAPHIAEPAPPTPLAAVPDATQLRVALDSGLPLLRARSDRAAHPLDELQLGFSTMLTVRDIAVSESFYVERLGFTVTERLETLRRLERRGATLYIITESPPTIDKPGVTLVPPPERERPSINLVFRVADVRDVHRRLQRLGVPFLTAPHQPAWGGWRCFAQDPDGYLIEFEQP